MNKSHSLTVDEALAKMMQYCVYQDRCHQEVEKKLDQLAMFETAKAHIMAALIKDDFLNEERFSKSFARGKFRIKKWGRIRIVRELKQRHISQFNIKTALKEIDDAAYIDTIEKLAEKKFDQLNMDCSRRSRQKIYQYLAYRGYEYTLIYDTINQLCKQK
ncbi:MAG: RecX family transcriptional regulator [Psychroflexus sp.]|nr:RecX family transcriptional regulator [Psychroflexus sp.]MDN6309176.1 RecX family transcriptional regulator [Psychroflexus sp.]